MLLTDLISLSTDFATLSLVDQTAYLQKAYEIVVDDIRLDCGMFPVLFKTDSFTLGKFQFKGIRTGVASEIAFKEIKSMLNVDFEAEGTFKSDSESPLIGELNLTYYGFAKADYDAMNAIHTIKPIIFNSKQYYECQNFDDLDSGFCIIQAYQYPYPVHTEYGSFIDEHRYSISWMITTYGLNTLIVDDLLGILIILKACQLLSEDNLNISNAKNFDYVCTAITNMFNEDRESMRNNRLTTLGFMALGN